MKNFFVWSEANYTKQNIDEFVRRIFPIALKDDVTALKQLVKSSIAMTNVAKYFFAGVVQPDENIYDIKMNNVEKVMQNMFERERERNLESEELRIGAIFTDTYRSVIEKFDEYMKNDDIGGLRQIFQDETDKAIVILAFKVFVKNFRNRSIESKKPNVFKPKTLSETYLYSVAQEFNNKIPFFSAKIRSDYLFEERNKRNNVEIYNNLKKLLEIHNIRMPQIEDDIAAYGDLSLLYAQNLDKPFPAGEDAIAVSGRYSIKYAELLAPSNKRFGRFEKGEPAMFRDLCGSLGAPHKLFLNYISEIEKPFPAAEPYIALYAEYSYEYALKNIKGPFPAGENSISKLDEIAVKYAKNVLGSRFEKGEEAIVHGQTYVNEYRRFLKKLGIEWDPESVK